jgi:pyrroloquinoline quinone (PQQ) biosynthesis protein C
MMLSHLQAHATGDPDRIALDPIVEPVLGYGKVASLIAASAKQYGRDHPANRPISLQLDHGPTSALAELALLEACIPVLSLPTFFSASQAEHAMAECGAFAHFNTPPVNSAEVCRTAPVPLPPGTARITFTSGSTGSPKGICLSAPHLMTVARSVVDAVGAKHAGRHLAVLPPGILLETVAGFFATMIAGGTYVCPPQALIGLSDPFRPDFPTLLQTIADWGITSLILVPEYLAGLVQAMAVTGLRLPALTLVAVGGARTPTALIARARELGLPVRQGYGLTECGSVVSLENDQDRQPGSVGHPLGHLRARIAADGEILLDGPTCLGTIGAPRNEGALATGDLGHIDETGRLWIEGRKSNLIVTTFGRNVSPEWVEEALLVQPDIAQAMVYGDGLPAPEALLVPARADADLSAAVAAANATLPVYARIAAWREASHFTPCNGQLTSNGRLRRKAIAGAYLTASPPFFNCLEASTIRHRLRFLGIRQVRAGLAGEIDRETYVAYLTQAWHHVRHTVPLFREALQRLGHRPEQAAAMARYIAEEVGHDDWILLDIAAAGGDREAVRHSKPAAATQAMVARAYDSVRNGNPLSLFGMVYVLESVSVALAQRGASAVRERLGLPAEAFTYLTSHGALDHAHMSFFAEQVNGLDDPQDRVAIVSLACEMFDLFGGIFASIPLEFQNAAA